MGEHIEVRIEQLKPGDRLGQDIMVHSSVLLRRGSVLTEAHISHIRRLNLTTVVLQSPGTAAPDEEVAVAEAPGAVPGEAQLPDFSQLSTEDTPAWIADESFSQKVVQPRELPEGERVFAQQKEQIRADAGLAPLIDPQADAELQKGLHATYINSAVKGTVDMERLGELATQLWDLLEQAAGDYLSFVDIPRYGQVLAARSAMTGKVFGYAKMANGGVPADEQMRAHFAICGALALMPQEFTEADTADVSAQRQLKDLMLEYYAWLRSQRYVSERALELLLLRFERFDGRGIPYGLAGAMIPEVSQSWSLAWHYSSQLFSLPLKARVTARTAAEQLVQQSGTTFASSSVNHFLRQVGYYPLGALVELNDGRFGLVTRQHEDALLKPVIREVDTSGAVGAELDLREESETYIRRQVLEY